ncbi:MAG: DUF1759 domain-containing protein, partial [Gammaproteobacteria bacterium]|nr:DUF1759 domain-containing protein [Gammaproteobacteria bacterium]
MVPRPGKAVVIKAMSGSIRKTIGPTRKRILDILQQVQAKEHFRVDSGLQENEQITQVRYKISDLKTLIARLKAAVAILGDKHNEWAKLLASLGGEALEKEEAAYEAFDKAPARHFVEVMLEGEDVLIGLEIRLKELYNMARSLELSSQSDSQDRSQHGSEINPHHRVAAEVNRAEESPHGPPRKEFRFPVRRPQSVKLPRTPLLDFYGDILKWKPFWDSFCSHIHSRDDLSDADKFHYLLCLVKGRALIIIEGIPVTGKNYRLAIQLLQERYASTRAVVESLYTQLEKISQCGMKTMELQNTYDAVEKLLRQLETLQENLDHSALISQVKKKFPGLIRQKIEEIHNSDVDWSMVELRQ